MVVALCVAGGSKSSEVKDASSKDTLSAAQEVHRWGEPRRVKDKRAFRIQKRGKAYEDAHGTKILLSKHEDMREKPPLRQPVGWNAEYISFARLNSDPVYCNLASFQ